MVTILFEATGTTIKQFGIVHKIERVKELLIYDELNLSDILSEFNCNSVAHFKKVMGLTPTFFKKLMAEKK